MTVMGRARTLLVMLFVLVGCTTRSPEVIYVQDLPDDLSATVESAWSRFLDALPAQRGCIESVYVGFVSDVPDGDASYRRDDRVISIQIPTSPARFDESFVHELAHHVESTCPAQRDLRAGFLAAQGFASDAEWDRGTTWADTPSEQFAEAIVLLVNGTRLLHDDDIVLADGALDIVAGWARGH